MRKGGGGGGVDGGGRGKEEVPLIRLQGNKKTERKSPKARVFFSN